MGHTPYSSRYVSRFISAGAIAIALVAGAASCGSDSSKTEGPPAADGNRPVIPQETYTPSTTPTAPPSSTAPPSTPDAAVPDDGPKVPKTAKECFKDLEGAIVGPDYDKYAPKI